MRVKYLREVSCFIFLLSFILTSANLSAQEKTLKADVYKIISSWTYEDVIRQYGEGEQMIDLCKTLKSKCGVGGSVEHGEIIIQGDQRKRLIKEMLSLGYSNVKNAGA